MVCKTCPGFLKKSYKENIAFCGKESSYLSLDPNIELILSDNPTSNGSLVMNCPSVVVGGACSGQTVLAFNLIKTNHLLYIILRGFKMHVPEFLKLWWSCLFVVLDEEPNVNRNVSIQSVPQVLYDKFVGL